MLVGENDTCWIAADDLRQRGEIQPARGFEGSSPFSAHRQREHLEITVAKAHRVEAAERRHDLVLPAADLTQLFALDADGPRRANSRGGR